MKLVKSQGPNDCGICVVATVLGISWEEARKRVFGSDRDRKGYITKTKQITEALHHKILAMWHHQNPYGLLHVGHWLLSKAERWQSIPAWRSQTSYAHLAVVNVRPQGAGKCGHWVIWDGKKVYCPQSGRAWPAKNCPWEPVSYFRVMACINE